jgi:hypothetical protein
MTPAGLSTPLRHASGESPIPLQQSRNGEACSPCDNRAAKNCRQIPAQQSGCTEKTPEPVHLILTVDVEEEGLFCDRFPRRNTVRNVPFLRRLLPLLARFDLPLTLLCDYPVFRDTEACRAMDALRKAARVEIGAHLHHWNTPPFPGEEDDDAGGYVDPKTLPPDLFQERMDTLFAAGREYAGHPLTSFRMGRWHLHRRHWPHLARAGVLVDASVRPLYSAPPGPDYFAAPAEPYRVTVEGHTIIESPCTGLPLYPALPRHLRRLESAAPGTALARTVRALRHAAPQWGAAFGLMPVYLGLAALKWVAGRHLARGGRFLSLTWHSSELMPGGTPHLPDETSVNALLARIAAFCAWLHEKRPVRGLVLDDLRRSAHVLPFGPEDDGGDWRPNS